MKKNVLWLPVLFATALLTSLIGPAVEVRDRAGESDRPGDEYFAPANAPAKVGYEILQIQSPRRILVWASGEITQEEFDALDLPWRWRKNQPRELDFVAGAFARSPGATTDGPLTRRTLFGHEWRHVATVTRVGLKMDEEGLLSGNKIEKHHRVTFAAGTNLSVIVSPTGERYVRLTRDAGRTREVPTIPDSWQYYEQPIDTHLTLHLPNPTINIRTDNEDSFQGPIAPEELDR